MRQVRYCKRCGGEIGISRNPITVFCSSVCRSAEKTERRELRRILNQGSDAQERARAEETAEVEAMYLEEARAAFVVISDDERPRPR